MPTLTLYRGEATADEAPRVGRPQLRLVSGQKGVILVAVADQHRRARSSVRVLLEDQTDVQVTGEAGTGAEAVELARRTRPDVVVLDSTLPAALETTRQILDQSDGRTRVLLLSAEERGDCIVRALRAGARGVLAKDSCSVELLRAVRVVARGDALLSPSITRALISRCVEG